MPGKECNNKQIYSGTLPECPSQTPASSPFFNYTCDICVSPGILFPPVNLGSYFFQSVLTWILVHETILDLKEFKLLNWQKSYPLVFFQHNSSFIRRSSFLHWKWTTVPYPSSSSCLQFEYFIPLPSKFLGWKKKTQPFQFTNVIQTPKVGEWELADPPF